MYLSTALLSAICDNHNVEVFHVDAATARDNRKREGEDAGVPIRAGWHFWTCSPGCLPDSDAFGPYRSARAAALAAVDTFQLVRKYEWFINLDERGEFSADLRDEVGRTVYAIQNMEAAQEFETDGFGNPRSARDVRAYLIGAGMIDAGSEVIKGN